MNNQNKSIPNNGVKIGIFGGAFNPIHNGHILLAKEVAKRLGLHKMLIIPTGKSPHKDTPLAPFSDRMEMCKLAFEGVKGFEVSGIEGNKKGVSYTIETLHELRRFYPNNTIFNLIIGGDMLFGFKKWFKHELLLKECTVIAAPRTDTEYIDLLEYSMELGRVKVLNIPTFEVSSTEIRNNIKADKDISGLVPEVVAAYIKDNNLYRG